MKPFYITTTLPYVNGVPHIGHCVEFMRADMVARYQRQQEREVFFNTGSDEHGQKLAEKATELGQSPKEYVDEMVETWHEFCKTINMSNDRFIRTTDTDHEKAAQEMWRRCEKNGHIYKKNYQSKYCVGCELEKTDSGLESVVGTVDHRHGSA